MRAGKRFLLRSAPRPAASLALRAAGVALPPTIQALAGSASGNATHSAKPRQRRRFTHLFNDLTEGAVDDGLDLEDVRAFQVHLVAVGISWPACDAARLQQLLDLDSVAPSLWAEATPMRDSIGSVNTHGNYNSIRANIRMTIEREPPPPASSVDIQKELAALRDVLQHLSGPESARIGQALDAAQQEGAQPTPDKPEIQGRVQRALKLADTAVEVADTAEKLTPIIARIAGWLGVAISALLG